MSFLRPASSVLRSSALRPALKTAPRACLQARFASSQGYGDGKGDPVAENPQKQGKNPSEKHEHPGPEPPKVARGKGKSPDESGSSSSSSSQSAQKSSSNDASSSSNSNKGIKGAQPKILSGERPNEDDPSVRKHNEEMDNRADRAHERLGKHEANGDKVSKGFWAGRSKKSPTSFFATAGLVLFVAGNWVYMGSGPLGFLDVN